jgi:uncharacterized protein YbjT (DUF2867 family)
VNAAVLGKATGFQTFLLVSSVGANPESDNFYIQLKGNIEKDITAVGFKSTGIFRPSMLLGERNEKRIAERVLQPISKLFSFFLFGNFSKSKAMIEAAKKQIPGTHVYEYDNIMKLAAT